MSHYYQALRLAYWLESHPIRGMKSRHFNEGTEPVEPDFISILKETQGVLGKHRPALMPASVLISFDQ